MHVPVGGSGCVYLFMVLDAHACGPPGHFIFQLYLTGINKHRLVWEQVPELQALTLPWGGWGWVAHSRWGMEIGPWCGGNPQRGPSGLVGGGGG